MQQPTDINAQVSRFDWRVHHKQTLPNSPVVVEVRPKRGLLPRWRFVLPAAFDGVIEWGVGERNNPAAMRKDMRGESSSDGTVQLIDGPQVVWFGALEPLSSRLSAYLVFVGVAPHYIMFGQAESTHGPPQKLEGITFGQPHKPQ